MPSAPRATALAARRGVLLLAAVGIVHCTWVTATSAQVGRSGKSADSRSTSDGATRYGRGAKHLPPAVTEMRAAILAAVETGDIAELKGAMDLNELKPEFGGPVGLDPIAYLKSLSADGSGKDVLDVLGRLLEGGWASVPVGRDIENNRVYVWPHFAEARLDALTPKEKAELAALVGAETARSIVEAGRWQGWRLSIGADGVWHTFAKVN